MRDRLDWIAPIVGAALAASGHGQEPSAAPPAPPAAPPAQGTAPGAPQGPAAPATPPAPAAPAAPAAGAAQPAAPAAQAPAAIPPIRFSFKDQTWDQVLDWFSRTTRLPVVRETPVPQGTVDFLSPRNYTLAEALQTLNVLLQTQSVMLRQEGDTLFLQKLDDMKRENVPTYVGTLPASVTDDQIVTVVVPLLNSRASAVAEQLKGLVAAYGSVTALEQSNSLIVVETAANVRRLQKIVNEIDKTDVESAIEYFPLRSAKASQLLQSLNALMGERQVEYVIQPDGKKVKVTEDKISGLAIAADDRANAIIGRGNKARLEQLRRTIDMLDVPAGGGPRTMRMVPLSRASTAEAKQRVDAFMQTLPVDRRATVIPMPESSRLTLVGDAGTVAEAARFLEEFDGPAPAGAQGERGVRVVPLQNGTGAAMLPAVKALMTPRQQSAVQMTAGADDRSVIAAGTAADLEAVAAIVDVLDRPGAGSRQVRLLRVNAKDPAAAVEKARQIHAAQSAAGDPAREVTVSFEGPSRQVMLIGAAPAIAEFESALRTAEEALSVDRETRQFTLASATPSQVAASLSAMAPQLLRGGAGRAPGAAPEFSPVDPLHLLVVTAAPEEMSVLAETVKALDRPGPQDQQVRVVPISGTSPKALVERARALYTRGAAAAGVQDLPTPEVEVDADAGAVVIAGRPAAVSAFERALAESRRLLPPDRTGRLFTLSTASAAAVAEPLRQVLARTAPMDPARAVPAPTVEVVEATNGLFVSGEPAQLSAVEQIVRQLDRADPGAMPPLRLLQIRAADAEKLAAMLMQRYDARAPELRREQPVRVDADGATNTLIVTAHETVFQEIRDFVEGVNRAADPAGRRETIIVPLKVSRAEVIAQALDRLYPQPPMPLDSRGRPLPHLQKPKEVFVAADAATNSLIIEAPAERRAGFEALVQQLDRVSLPPQGELRTWRLERGEPAAVAAALQSLAQKGVFTAPAAEGGKPIDPQVTVDAASRTLIVAASPAVFERMEQVLNELQAIPPRRTVRVYDAGAVKAPQLAEQLRDLYRQAVDGVPGADAVEVSADADAGTLMVVADEEAQARVAQILQAAQQAHGGAVDVRLLPLEHARASEVAEVLRQMAAEEQSVLRRKGGSKPAVEAVERTNSLLVSATPDQHPVIASLVKGLDVRGEAMPPLRIIQLRSADAANLADALNRNYGQRSPEERQARPVQITADTQTNSLVVSAHPDALAEIEAIASQVNDLNRPDAAGREIRIFPLKVARAPELAKTIDEMFPQPPVPVDPRGRPRPELQPPREVTVRADRQTNSLIVDAPAARLPGFEKLVEQLDRAEATSDVQVRTWRLKRSDLESVAGTLRQMAASGQLGSRAAGAAVVVTTDPATRTLVVSGPADAFGRIDEVLKGMDAPKDGPATVLRTFKLKNARAESMAGMLREVLTSRLSRDLPDSAADVKQLLDITADRKTNTLIISAPDAIMQLAEQLVKQLDDASAAAGDPVVRVRPLTFADAAGVASSLQAALPSTVSRVTGEPISVKLVPASGANALVMVGLAPELDEVEKLIEPLDSRPALDAIDAKTFDLKFASAATIAPILERLLTDQQETDPRVMLERMRRTRGQLDLVPRVRVEADPAGNRLLVSGPQRTVSLAGTLLEQLDRREGGERTFKTFTPARGDAAQLAKAVTAILDATQPGGRRSAAELLVEPQSGAIVVVGEQGAVGAAMEALTAADARTVSAPQVDLRMLALKHSDPASVAAAVQPLLADRSRWPAGLAAWARSGGTVAEPRVAPDAAGGRVLISAPAELMPMATALVAQLDVPRSPGSTMDVRVYPLSQADSADVAKALQQALDSRAAARPGAPKPVVAAERSSNSVVVTAAGDDLEAIEKLIQPLDSGVAKESAQVRTVFLRQARAETVAPLVEKLLAEQSLVNPADLPQWARAEYVRTRLAGAGRTPVRVAADSRLNAVVVAAPTAVLNVAEQLIGQLDAGGAAGQGERTVRVLTIRDAEAGEIASALEQVFAGESGAEPPPVIRVNAASNSLLVRASERQFAVISQVVDRLDKATISSGRMLRTVPIDPSRADAAEVARLLERMVGPRDGGGVEVIQVEELLQRYGGGTAPPPAPGSGPAPAGAAQPAGAAPAPKGAAAPEAPRSLAEPVPPGSWMRLRPMHERVLEQLFAAAVDVQAEPQELPTIAVDKATNSLILLGSPRAVERLARLAEQAQEQLPAPTSVVKVIPMPEGVDPVRLRNLVSESLRLMTPAGGKPGDLARRTSIVADAAARTLVITATEPDFRAVAPLVAALVRAPVATELTVKVYPLKSITAARAAAALRDIITGGQSGQGGRGAELPRELAVTFLAGGRSVEATFDPARVRVAADPAANALIVMGPPAAVAFADQFVTLADQQPLDQQATLRLFPLRYAAADELATTLRTLFQARSRSQGGAGQGTGEAEFAQDPRTNTLLVTAGAEPMQEVERILTQLDVESAAGKEPLRIFDLAHVSPQSAEKIVKQAVLGNARRATGQTLVMAEESAGLLVVRAAPPVMEEIATVLKEIDREAAAGSEARVVKLERADAQSVADVLQRFFDDRAKASSAGRARAAQRTVSVVADPRSGTLLVSGSDSDFAEVERIVKQLDAQNAASDLQFRIFPLKYAEASEIADTVKTLAGELMMSEMPFMWSRGPSTRASSRDAFAVRADDRLNALVVTGRGDRFAMVESLLAALDTAPAEGQARQIRFYRLKNADIHMVVQLANDALGKGAADRRWWDAEKASRARIVAEPRTNTLIVTATAAQQAEVAAVVKAIDDAVAVPQTQTAVLALEFAPAPEMAETLRRFLADRARAENRPSNAASIVASQSANTLLVAASAEDMATIRDLLSKVDQPSASGDRTIEIVKLQKGLAQDLGRIVQEQFSRKAGGAQGVLVTADVRTNSLILNAPNTLFPQVKALVSRLDTPTDADETVIRTFALTGAKADEAVRILSTTLQLDATGRTRGITIRLEEGELPPVQVKARVVADKRSNSLVVTATPESIPVLEHLISKLDAVPSKPELEYRVLPLKYVQASEMSFTLRQIVRGGDGGEPEVRVDYDRAENRLVVGATPEQFKEIERILKELDRPSERARTTDFVALKHAQAEQVREALSFFYGPAAVDADNPGKRSVLLVADPASNSLVISAAKEEWDGIRALLAKLDSAEYDASLQLKVLPLTHADATSVAEAINAAFRGPMERRPQENPPAPEAPKKDGDKNPPPAPATLVPPDQWVSAAAEPRTNSIIISASRQNLKKIEDIISQLDVAEFAKLPAPRLIPVRTGSPEQLANALRQLYTDRTARAGAPATGRDEGGRSVRIVGDVASGVVIVRASDEEYQAILALADALQQQADSRGLAVHVLKLKQAPASRVATAVREAFAARARQANLPFSIQTDAGSNAVVVAATGALWTEVEATVNQLDQLAPAAGQNVLIIDLHNVPPETVQRVIQTIGLDRAQPADSTSRLVTEPIRVAPVPARNAVLVVANPGDRETVVALIKAIDEEPKLAEMQVQVVRLRNASAAMVVRTINEMLVPAAAGPQLGAAGNAAAQASPLLRALQEQVRRLSLRRDGVNQPDIVLDLAKPVKLLADERMNAVVIGSSPSNVAALREAVQLFDSVPAGDGVTVKILPLENMAASQFARVVRELFQQGRNLANLPLTQVKTMPGGEVGKALVGEVAISVDERTNTVVVAGRDEAVAFVEVLKQKLDSDAINGWVEPRVLPLRFADARDLAQTLREVMPDGQPGAGGGARGGADLSPLQRQVARLRLLKLGPDGAPKALDSDTFQPLTHLVIRPDANLNALVCVGTPANLDVVAELVRMMDVEAASPSALVRVYPIQNASATRLSTTVQQLFEAQFQAKAIRAEDRLKVVPDERTNSLVVSTSTRSFAVFEQLLKQLDQKVAPEIKEIRTVALNSASAVRLAPIIQQVMDARLDRLRKIQPETAELERAVVVADSRSNSLIVAAANESWQVAEKLIADLDRENESEQAGMNVLSLKKGNLDRVANAINQIMDRRYADLPAEVRRRVRPMVLTDPRTSSLIIAAAPGDFADIERVVTQLEATPLDPAVAVEVMPLATARAEQLAPRLQTLMRERMQTLGQAETPSDRVSVAPDPGSNSLIVAANAENMAIVRGLVDALTKAGEEAVEGRQVEVVLLTKSRAQDLVPVLNDLYITEQNRRRGESTVKATAEQRLNALLITGLEPDVQTVKRMATELDGTRPSTVVEIKYIPLASANVVETVSLIENVLAGNTLAGGRPGQQATVVKYLRQLPGAADGTATETEVSAAVRASISLVPDIRTNTVIARAPRDAMELLDRMIRDLDQSSAGSQSIKVFRLTNADAQQMARVLTELFNLKQQGNLFVLKPREPDAAARAAAAGAGGAAPGAAAPGETSLFGSDLSLVPDARQALSITVDSRTNSLLVSGTPNYLELVDKVVKQLDSQPANERETMVFALKNATAEDVARIVTQFVDTDQKKVVQTLGTGQVGSASRLLEREVTIVGDKKTNSVLVTASPRYLETLQTVIRELDVDPPQVLIQVVLAEVTLGNTEELGVEFTRFRVGSVNVAGGFGLNRGNFVNGAAQVPGLFGLAPAIFGGAGVPNIAIGGADFDLLINALKSQNRVQLLSNPSVMVANNTRGRIQVGDTVRLPASVSFGANGQQSSVVPEEIGVILQVTPSINPDGFVRLEIEPEISRLSAETTKISENFESPVISRRRANTTVTVKDGQTVVIGGLIQDRFERVERKIPFLGDIPILGWIFTNKSEDAQKTELLIVMTPHVVRSPESMRKLSDGMLEKMSVGEEMRDQLRSGELKGLEGMVDKDGRLVQPMQEGVLGPVPKKDAAQERPGP
ncbi:MAG: secretin N-terminal domain-containing protein [Phycisphaerales bacterium]